MEKAGFNFRIKSTFDNWEIEAVLVPVTVTETDVFHKKLSPNALWGLLFYDSRGLHHYCFVTLRVDRSSCCLLQQSRGMLCNLAL